MSLLKQRIPLAYDAQGKPLHMNLEWFRSLTDAISGATSTPTDITALTAQVAALQTSVNSLLARVIKLEDRYQP